MKKVLITGASRGIGAKCAELFALNGYDVWINYLSSEKAAEALYTSLIDKNCSAHVIKADVSDSYQVNKLLEKTGGTDILVNNAGISQTKLFTDISADEWRHMISVNLDGVFNCCQSVLPYMIHEKYGRIVIPGFYG